MSLLISLFSYCHIALTVPENGQLHARTKPSPRDVAFYDELLTAQVSLHIPTSSALPPPQRGFATYALPISIDESEEDPLEERTEQARATRLGLLAFLSCLNVDLRGSYVSPRAPLPPGSNIVPPTTAATPTSASNVPHHQRPIPSLDPRDAAYSEPTLPGDEAYFYSTAWQGNKQPAQPPSRNTASERIRAARKRVDGGNDELSETTSYVTWDQVEERWLVSWSIKVPVIYTRHRHPRPALLLTSSLALRLSASSALLTALNASLSGASPFLALLHPIESPSWSDHDLLTSLSAGPVYPDESPSQRAARAASALAKLPLSRLPSKVLGSRLVTPERSGRDIGRRISSRIATPSMNDDDDEGDQEGDVTDTSSSATSLRSRADTYSTLTSSSSSSSSSSSPSSSRPSSSHHSNDHFSRNRDLSENGLLMHDKSLQATSAADMNHGEAVVTLNRSARCVMDVRSAVGAKMRTTTVDNVSLDKIRRRRRIASGRDDDDGGEDAFPLDEMSDATGRALILCVELDNPSDSGLFFDVESCELDITVPGASASSTTKYVAKATLMDLGGEAAIRHAFRLAQGEQRNLLYFVHFETTAGGDGSATLWPTASSNAETARNVAIVVHGRPLLLAGHDAEPRDVTPSFSSTWNCTLDMQSLDRDLRRKTAAALPTPNVLESAAAAAGAKSSNSKAPAVSVGGSMKYSASSLSSAATAAAQQDAFHNQQQQHAARYPTASSRPNPPSRINTGGSLQAPTPSRGVSPVPPFHGHGEYSERIPSVGAGLLAQARLRAASAQQRVASDASLASNATTATTSTTAGTSSTSTPRDRTSSRRVFSTASTAVSRAVSGAGPGAAEMSPLEKEVLPLGFDRSYSASTPGDYLGGVLINARVYGGGEGKSTAPSSSLLPAHVRQLDTFTVELFVSNRSDRVKSFVLRWCNDVGAGGGGEEGGTAQQQQDHATRLNRSSSLTSIASTATTRAQQQRLMDAQTVYQRHSHAQQAHTALLPLEQDISTGPILPEQSTRVYLPLQALTLGVHSLDDLSVVDEETGSERILRCGGAGGAAASTRGPAARGGGGMPPACVVVVVAGDGDK